eukprot:c27798_g1_i1 orf=332-1816(-)
MEALIASYGSDGEEDAPNQPLQSPHRAPALAGSSLFASLPPPKFSSHDSLLSATSVPSSRPGLETGAAEEAAAGADCAVGLSSSSSWVSSPSRRSILGCLPPPKVAGERSVGISERNPLGGGEWESLLGSGGEEGKLGIFSSLPAPKGESGGGRSSLMGSVLPRPVGQGGVAGSKRVVEFKPPVNKVLLEASEDEVPSRKKRHAAESISMKHTDGLGLVGILPPPKNTLGAGSALGGGVSGQGGRRVALDIVSDVSDSQILERQSSEDDPLIGKPAVSSSHISRMENTWETQNADFTGHRMSVAPGQASGMRSHGWMEGQDSGMGSDRFCNEPVHSGSMDDALGMHHYQTQTSNAGTDFSVEQIRNHGTTYEFGHHQPSPLPNASFDAGDPLASIMKYEKKKGREKFVPAFIEVKQDDLTNEVVLEDKLKTTGIAFGPTYQSLSSSKNKPSKMHRRKHQIGSLYYDMKQKEMELLERRARGQLTKAETQAKYGW